MIPLCIIALCGFALCGLIMAHTTAASTLQPSPSEEVGTAQSTMQALRGQYRTVSSSTDGNRAHNIKLACEALDGTTIMPRATMSFNDVVGNTEQDGRYAQASIIRDYGFAEARGGGICQVSSTLYVGALKAGLTVGERHPHTIAPDYAACGLDAAVSFAVLDLTITNTTDEPIRIEASAWGQVVEVSVFGVPFPEGTAYEAASVIVDCQQGEGITDGDSFFLTVLSYRAQMKDGAMVSRRELATDAYLVPVASTQDSSDSGTGAKQYSPSRNK